MRRLVLLCAFALAIGVGVAACNDKGTVAPFPETIEGELEAPEITIESPANDPPSLPGPLAESPGQDAQGAGRLHLEHDLIDGPSVMHLVDESESQDFESLCSDNLTTRDDA